MLLSSKRVPVIAAACLLGLIATAFASYLVRSGSDASARPSPAADKQRNPLNTIAALGRIEPWTEIVNLGAGTSPDRLETLFVNRGDLVKMDQVLGYLGGYAEQIAQRDVYRAQLDEARVRLKTEVALNQARIEAAEVHQKQILEVSPHRIAAQEATISGIEAKLANDKDILDSQQQLLSRGTATRRQLEDQKTVTLQSESNLAAARARLSELKHQFDIDRIDASTQIEVAHATLERMRTEYPIASLEHQIILAEARAKRLTLSAPIDGKVLNVRVKPGEEIGSGPVLTLGDTARMRAVAEIYETDIARVRLGQAATISSRVLPKPVGGKVARIGNLVFKNDVLNVDPAARADPRIVQVWIDLDDDVLLQGLTNLTVDVLISAVDHDTQATRSATP